MKLTPVILAAVVVGLIVVDAQVIPAVPDDRPALNETQDGWGAPGSPPGFDTEDPSKRERTGDRYSWDHDIGSGDTVSERAFAPNGSSVIIVKSRDRTLPARNITRAMSIYYFTDLSALVAIIPWRFFGPCLIRNTTLNYQEAINLLAARNGSTVQTTSRVSIDGNVAPLSPEASAAFLESNPGLRRPCRSRPIIITTDLGDNPVPYSNSTEEIITLTLEADVSITVPERPDVPDPTSPPEGTSSPRRPDDQSSRWGFRRDNWFQQGSFQTPTGA